MKLPSDFTAHAGTGAASTVAEHAASGAAGNAGGVASASAGIPDRPAPSGDVSVQNVPRSSVDAGVQSPQPSADAGMPDGPDASPAGTLMLTFTTATNGRYAPRNAGAAWIETGSGTFVKTLERWTNLEARKLTRWTVASGGWGGLFGMANTQDMMDAISRATLRTHETHQLTWNLKDAQGMVVPDGSYQVVIEVVDNNTASISSAIPFEKGRDPFTVMAPDMPPFVGFTLVYQP